MKYAISIVDGHVLEMKSRFTSILRFRHWLHSFGAETTLYIQSHNEEFVKKQAEALKPKTKK